MQKIVAAAVTRLVDIGSIEPDNRDIYEYGLHIILSTGINLAITLTLGFVFGIPLETLLMFVSFTVLRSVAGGYHAATLTGCIAVSTISIVVAITAMKLLPITAIIPATSALAIFSLLVVFVFGPSENANRPMSTVNDKRFQKAARIIIIVEILLAILLSLYTNPRYG